MNLDLALFILLIALLALQFEKRRIPRVLVTIAVLVLSAVVVFDYQITLYVCQSEQRSIARMFQASQPTDDITWAITAANRYWRDKEKSSNEEPNYRSYFSYLREEPNAPDVYDD